MENIQMSRCHRFFTLQRITDWDSLRPDRVHSYRFESFKASSSCTEKMEKYGKINFSEILCLFSYQKSYRNHSFNSSEGKHFPTKMDFVEGILVFLRDFLSREPIQENKFQFRLLHLTLLFLGSNFPHNIPDN